MKILMKQWLPAERAWKTEYTVIVENNVITDVLDSDNSPLDASSRDSWIASRHTVLTSKGRTRIDEDPAAWGKAASQQRNTYSTVAVES